MGFSIRKATHYKSKKKENMITALHYVCSKEGHSKPKSRGAEDKGTPKKLMRYTRTGCKAHLRVKRINNEKWEVVTFVKEHNHDLVVSPSKTRFLRSHRSITPEQKKIIHMLSEQKISTSQIMSFIATNEGGSQNIHFTRRDLSNEISERNRRLKGIDISSTLNYFRERQAKDPSFFYAIEIDEQNMARNLFWIDGRSRMAYQNFGDVITFDTTYMTNKYSMPFAPIIGVNHHRQSIFFGCALIRDETSNTFVWLFKTWLQAVFEKHPASIITDQDPAMRKAIEQIFPNTVHRCCQWHIMRKAREHLGILYSTKEGFKKELISCVNDSITVKEFESRWAMMIEKYELHNTNHLNVMWNSRHQWVPAFFKEVFFAEMSTSQRSESMNALTKMFTDNHTSVYNFVLQFDKMVSSRYDKEDEEDFRSKDGELSLWSHNPIEMQARSVYTKRVFSEFKNQFRYSTGYDLTELENNSYKISAIQYSTLPNQGIHSHIVNVVPTMKKLFCTCKFFEFSGLLCSHILKVMIHIRMYEILPHYIMRRWTKDAKKGSSSMYLASTTASDTSSTQSLRFNELTLKAQKLVFETSKSVEVYKIVCEKFDKLVDEAISLRESLKEKQDENIEEVYVSPFTQSSEIRVTVNDPPQSQCKGKRKPQRFKPLIEKAAKKSRTCQHCRKKGHNIRTCQELTLEEKEGAAAIVESDD